MNKLNLCPIFLILFLTGLILLSLQFSGCGDNPTENTEWKEFLAWKAKIRQEALTPIQFVEYWNRNEQQNWQYDPWKKLNYTLWVNASAYEIWKVKLVNCVLITNVLQEFYPGGQEVHREQPGPDHVVYVWQGYIISFSGVRGEVFEGWENYPYYRRDFEKE